MKLKSSFLSIILSGSVLFFFTSCARIDMAKYKEGDIFFQTSLSRQSVAIQRATGSKFSHMGILIEHNGRLQIFEAVQPAQYTDLDKWIHRGKNNYFEVKRFVNSDRLLTSTTLVSLRRYASNMLGRNYDKYFKWSDDEMYCSELVWKAYERCAGIELCPLRHLRDFKLTDPMVQMTMEKRYGKDIPYDEQVVSPADIYSSDKLVSVR